MKVKLQGMLTGPSDEMSLPIWLKLPDDLHKYTHIS